MNWLHVYLIGAAVWLVLCATKWFSVRKNNTETAYALAWVAGTTILWPLVVLVILRAIFMAGWERRT